MRLETRRLCIRDIEKEDAIPFGEMASDGSLYDCGFDKDCYKWMADWVAEAKALIEADNPNTEYLAYTITLKNENTVVGSIGCSYYEELREIGITYFIGNQYRNNGYASEAAKAYVEYFLSHYNVPQMIATIREENVSSWKVIEKVGFTLKEKKMYKDINDDKEEKYRFYEVNKLERVYGNGNGS